MKFYNIIICFVLGLLLNGCSEILTEDPVSLATSDGYYVTE